MTWEQIKSHIDTFYQWPENLKDNGRNVGETFKIGDKNYPLTTCYYKTTIEGYPLEMKWNYAKNVLEKDGDIIPKKIITKRVTVFNEPENMCYQRYWVQKGKENHS